MNLLRWFKSKFEMAPLNRIAAVTCDDHGIEFPIQQILDSWPVLLVASDQRLIDLIGFGHEVFAERAFKDTNPFEVFETAINNVKPLIEVRSKRVGGASYQVPMQVSPKRQQSLAFRWILQSARAKTGKPMRERLASELIDAYNEHGGAMTTRENIHRMAEANKAFAHFAW